MRVVVALAVAVSLAELAAGHVVAVLPRPPRWGDFLGGDAP